MFGAIYPLFAVRIRLIGSNASRETREVSLQVTAVHCVLVPGTPSDVGGAEQRRIFQKMTPRKKERALYINVEALIYGYSLVTVLTAKALFETQAEVIRSASKAAALPEQKVFGLL